MFEKPNVTGAQQVETAARTHYSLPGAFPLAPAGNQVTLRNDLSQTSARQPAPEGRAEETILPCAPTAPRPAIREALQMRRPTARQGVGLQDRHAAVTGIFSAIISASFKPGVFARAVS